MRRLGGIHDMTGLLGMTRGPLGWTPAAVAGLVAWYTAGPAWCFTDAGGSVPAGDGDAVQLWRDRSGSARDLSQSTANNRPTLRLVSGRYYVRFDGSNDSLGYDGVVPAAELIAGVFSTTNDAALVSQRRDSDGAPIRVLMTQTGLLWRARNDANTISTVTASDSAGYHMLVGYNGANMILRRDGTQVASGTAVGGTTTVNRLRLATDFHDAGALAGDTGEVVLASVAPSAGDLTLLETYLRSVWGTP